MKWLALASAMAIAASATAVARETPSDEASLLADATRAEDALRVSPLVERDAALNAYLHGILCRTAPAECAGLGLYIVNAPDFGVRTLPNGIIEVGAGLVWRAANDAHVVVGTVARKLVSFGPSEVRS